MWIHEHCTNLNCTHHPPEPPAVRRSASTGARKQSPAFALSLQRWSAITRSQEAEAVLNWPILAHFSARSMKISQDITSIKSWTSDCDHHIYIIMISQITVDVLNPAADCWQLLYGPAPAAFLTAAKSWCATSSWRSLHKASPVGGTVSWIVSWCCSSHTSLTKNKIEKKYWKLTENWKLQEKKVGVAAWFEQFDLRRRLSW